MVPLVTPFRDNERIDFTAWQEILDALMAGGVNGILAAGIEGEFQSLSEEERVVALRFCRQALAGRAPLYGNIGSASTRESVRLAQAAEAEGVDCLVAVSPYIWEPSPDELVDHYVEICHAVRVAVFGYRERHTGFGGRIEAQAENFAGFLDSGEASGPALESMRAGSGALVSACANVAPRALVEMWKAFHGGRLEDASRLDALVEPLRRALPLHTYPAAIKEAMRLAGLPAGVCRRPAGPVPPAVRETLAAIVATLRDARCLPEPVPGTRTGTAA